MPAIVRIVMTFLLATVIGGVVGWGWFTPSFAAPSQPLLGENSAPTTATTATLPGASAPDRNTAKIPEKQGAHTKLGVTTNSAPQPTTAPKSKRTASPDHASTDHANPDHASPDAKTPGAAKNVIAAAVLVPSHTDRQRDDDVDLLPRGPEAWVDVDLSAGHPASLTIRAGSLARDGGGAWRTFARARKVGILRGPQARVALLHLGFDREGQPVVAHIRTKGPEAIEGMIPLRVQNRPIRLRRVSSQQ